MTYAFPRFKMAASALSLAGLLYSAVAADEVCTSCGPQVSVNGSFAHHKDGPTVAINGAAGNEAAFREDINGTNFTVTVSGLPAGKYTVIISAADTADSGAGERVFNVQSGDTVLAKDFDI